MMADTKQTREDTEMTPKDDEFQQIKRKSRKRKMVEDNVTTQTQMDTNESLPKRPMLPPISAEKISVSSSLDLSIMIKKDCTAPLKCVYYCSILDNFSILLK